MNIWNKLSNLFLSKYEDLITVPYERTCRFFYWGWKLRNNYDWDCGHLMYLMINLKLYKMIEYSRKYGHLLWNTQEDGKYFRRLKIACELAKRLHKDDYGFNVNQHNKKWKITSDDLIFEKEETIHGAVYNTLCWRSDKGLTEKQKETKRNEFLKAYKNDDLQKLNEKKMLFKIMENNLDGWWD